MPRTLNWSAQSSFDVEHMLSAFSDEAYWLARLSNYGAGTDTLDSLTVDVDGSVTVATTLSVFGDRLPAMVTQVYRGDVKMVRTETWSRAGDGGVRGQISTVAHGAPLSVLTEALLVPVPEGSMVTYTTMVHVRVPLVGGKIENHIASRVPEQIAQTHRFTMAWISEKRPTRLSCGAR